ncbi:MAG TPA: hypothetical protein VMS31_22715 [Pyrinomonadaceae bacterium]|nr:hypothetical protein [Pyrinomonadaceae bacterium]
MSKKLATKKPRSANKAAKSGSARSKKSDSKKTKTTLSPSEKRFVRDVLIRGEAAKQTPSGDLPPGATHRIVEDDEEGLPAIERERFSLY